MRTCSAKVIRSSGLLLIAALLGCMGGGGGGGAAAGGGGGSGAAAGGGSGSGAIGPAVGQSAKEVEAKATVCGSSCTADLAAAEASLADGRFADAYEGFQCANTAQAAFGAGLSRLLGAVESSAADQVLADLGMPHFPASALVGPDSYMSRSGARWNGQGSLSLSGDREIAVTFARARAGDDIEEFEADGDDGGRRIEFSVGRFPAPPTGSHAVQYDCTTGSQVGDAPNVSFQLTEDGHEFDCSIPYSLDPSSCVASAGELIVHSAGLALGELVDYELVGIRFECKEYDPDTDEVVGLPLTIMATGRVSATLSDDVDASDLHPLLRSLPTEQVPDDVTLTTFLQHAVGIADDFAAAACFFGKAAEGSGVVFTLPGALYSGKDIPLTAGDAKVFAAASALGASALHLASAYSLDVSLRQLVCELNSDFSPPASNTSVDADPGAPGCGLEADFVDLVNAAARNSTVQGGPLQAGKYLLELGAAHLEDGVAKIDDKGAFVSNARSMAGWTALADFARATRSSLASGLTAVPYIEPEMKLDLQGFFDTPPDPSVVASMPLLEYAEMCDEFDCYTDVRFSPPYLNAFFDDAPGVDWDGWSYDVTAVQSDAMTATVDECMWGLGLQGFSLD